MYVQVEELEFKEEHGIICSPVNISQSCCTCSKHVVKLPHVVLLPVTHRDIYTMRAFVFSKLIKLTRPS